MCTFIISCYRLIPIKTTVMENIMITFNVFCKSTKQRNHVIEILNALKIRFAKLETNCLCLYIYNSETTFNKLVNLVDEIESIVPSEDFVVSAWSYNSSVSFNKYIKTLTNYNKNYFDLIS